MREGKDEIRAYIGQNSFVVFRLSVYLKTREQDWIVGGGETESRDSARVFQS